MPKIFTALDKNTLQVEISADVIQTITNTYRYDFLLAQREQIQKSRDADLADVEALIAEAERLGLTVESAAADVAEAATIP